MLVRASPLRVLLNTIQVHSASQKAKEVSRKPGPHNGPFPGAERPAAKNQPQDKPDSAAENTVEQQKCGCLTRRLPNPAAAEPPKQGHEAPSFIPDSNSIEETCKDYRIVYVKNMKKETGEDCANMTSLSGSVRFLA